MQNSSVKYILKLSIPIFFANLAIPMVGIIDTGLMGNLDKIFQLPQTTQIYLNLIYRYSFEEKL